VGIENSREGLEEIFDSSGLCERRSWDCEKMKLGTQDCRSDSSRSIRETDRSSKMATEGHKHAERKSPKLMNTTEMDKELADIKREMEELEMKMRQ
jgi:hypothetical protein